MYAVIQTGGKQYRVSPGEVLKVEKLPGEAGDSITFHHVLLASDGENVSIGKPYLEDAAITGRIVRHGKNRKVVVFKFKRRKKYRRTKGHRQGFTEVKIESLDSALSPAAVPSDGESRGEAEASSSSSL